MKIILRKIRVENNLTQQEVADMIGISLRMYQRIECAKSNGSVKIREKISDIFKMSSDKLFLKVKDIRKDESTMINTNKKLYDVDEFCTLIVVARRFCPCLAQDICQNLLPCFAA